MMTQFKPLFDTLNQVLVDVGAARQRISQAGSVFGSTRPTGAVGLSAVCCCRFGCSLVWALSPEYEKINSETNVVFLGFRQSF